MTTQLIHQRVAATKDAMSPAGYPPSSGGAAPQRMALSFRCGAASNPRTYQPTDTYRRPDPTGCCSAWAGPLVALLALGAAKRLRRGSARALDLDLANRMELTLIPTLLAPFRPSTSSQRTPEHLRVRVAPSRRLMAISDLHEIPSGK
jgi:hypothetical protein